MAVDLSTAPEPAADLATARALVVDTRRFTVGLSGRIAAVAARAAGSGRAFQLVTRSEAVLTVALDELLRDCDGTWVRHDGPGFREGRTGAPLAWAGDRFVVSGRAGSPARSDPGRGGVQVQVVTRFDGWAAPGEGTVGASVERVLAALTGAGAAGWGVAEPVGQRWTVREVDRHCRGRSPDPTALVVAGDDALATLRVEATATGLVERLAVCGPSTGLVRAEALDALADDLAGTAHTLVVGVQPGVVAGRREPGPLRPAVPWGLLVGAHLVGVRGARHALTAPARVRMLGGACWCRLTGGDADPLTVLADVLAHFGGVPDPRASGDQRSAARDR